MSVKISDVARRAGVSNATVSLALNGSSKINRATRAMIEALAKEMGYHPNPYAQKLVTQKSRQIGLIVPDIELNYYASLAKHIFNALTDSGYGISISTSMNSRLMERRAVSEMIENRMDGVLLAPLNSPNEDPGYLDMLDDANIPTELITSTYANLERPCVMCNLYEGTYCSMKMLYEHGYRRMAFFSGVQGAHSLDLRVQGYLSFLRDVGLEYHQIYHMNNVRYDDAQRCIAENGIPDAEAILCANDMMALGVINALLHRGVRVPDDIAVVGYDDSIFAMLSPVPITTVRQDIHQMATIAVNRMLNMIQGISKGNEEMITLIPCSIVERESVRMLR